MTRLIRAASVAFLAALTLPVQSFVNPSPVAAQAYVRANEIRANTPSCKDNPTAPVKGYVVGMTGSRPTRTYSFVGCFNTMAACEAWRGPTSGFITRRIIQNQCRQR